MVTPWAWWGRKVPQAEGNDQESTPGSSTGVREHGLATPQCPAQAPPTFATGEARRAAHWRHLEAATSQLSSTAREPRKAQRKVSALTPWDPGGNSNHPCCRGSAALPCSSPGGIEEAYFRSTNPLFSPGFALRWLAVP